MTLTLELGQNVPLTSLTSRVDQLSVGLGWDITQPGGPQVELVPAVLLVGEDGRAIAPDAFAFHNQLQAADGTVVASPDSETFDLDLAHMPTAVQRIVFVVFSDPDVRKSGTFTSVNSAYIRVMSTTDAELLRFTIPAQGHGVSVVKFGEMYRYNGSWKFRALGDGYDGGLTQFSAAYGVDLA